MYPNDFVASEIPLVAEQTIDRKRIATLAGMSAPQFPVAPRRGLPMRLQPPRRRRRPAAMRRLLTSNEICGGVRKRASELT